MSLHRAPVLLLAALLLLMPAAATHAVTSDADRHQTQPVAKPPNPAGLSSEVTRSSPRQSNTFVGVDGATYDLSPGVVVGTTGRLYFGEDFDSACWYGPRIREGLRRLAKLARVIERSGRRVLFTVAPNKTSVTTDELPTDMPHGQCSSRGIEQQNRILDRFSDPLFVPLRAALERQSRRGANVYWHFDTHWTTVAAAHYAMELASRLNPHIADLQRFRTENQSISVDLGEIGAIDQLSERGKGRISTTPVRVRSADPDTELDLDTLINPDVQWRSGPAGRTWRGNTLLLGDSFTYRSLSVLMPLFRHGHFMWLNAVEDDDVLAAIPRSDTVVLELVQRYVGVSRHAQSAFRKEVRQALTDYDRAHRR